MNGDLKVLGPEPFWQRQTGFGRQTDVKHFVAVVAIKMAMFTHIGAKVGGATIQRYLPHQPTFNQRIEAVINCGHRDFWHIMFGPNKDLLGGRMVAFLQQHRINVLALRREPKPAGRQMLIQLVTRCSEPLSWAGTG